MTLQEVLSKYDDAVQIYLEQHCDITIKKGLMSPATKKNYMSRLAIFREYFHRKHLRDDEVSDPTVGDIRGWDYELTMKGLSNITIRQYMVDLRAFFAFFIDNEEEEFRLYTRQPVTKRFLPRLKKEHERQYEEFLSESQINSLWDNTPIRKRGIKVGYWARNYAIVILLLTSKIREAELCDLTLSDIDFEVMEIHIRHGKGDKERYVELTDIAATALQLYLKSGLRPSDAGDADPLFGTTGGQIGQVGGTDWHPLAVRTVADIVRNHVRLVTGVDKITPHDLRHMGARLDYNSGVRAEALQRQLGHEWITTTQRYSQKLGTERKQQSAQRVYYERDRQARRNKELLEAID